MVYSEGVHTFWLFTERDKNPGTSIKFDTEEEARDFARGKVGRVDGPYLTSGEPVRYNK